MGRRTWCFKAWTVKFLPLVLLNKQIDIQAPPLRSKQNSIWLLGFCSFFSLSWTAGYNQNGNTPRLGINKKTILDERAGRTHTFLSTFLNGEHESLPQKTDSYSDRSIMKATEVARKSPQCKVRTSNSKAGSKKTQFLSCMQLVPISQTNAFVISVGREPQGLLHIHSQKPWGCIYFIINEPCLPKHAHF